tara:strand:+ start:3685 stop:4428 length:744 start_codon:yes stop_codon:yes gene_type:complete
MINTLAKNHLSSFSLGSNAQQRAAMTGDTEMRLVDGEPSHVNPVEASTIDAFGKKGEDMVKERGSGTINPYTGNREYVDPLTLGMAAVSFVGSWGAHEQDKKAAGVQLDLIRDSLDVINQSRGSLKEGYEAKKKAVSAEADIGMNKVQTATGKSRDELREGYETMIQQSGLATSGTAETKMSTTWKNISNAYLSAKDDLWAQIGAKMGDIEGWFESETGRLDADERRLRAERELHLAKSESKFLGIF